MKREILFYGNYFLEFYSKLDSKTREKIDFVLDLIRNVDKVPIKFLKYLTGTDGLFEIRVKTSKGNIRFFCFFDEDSLVIILNGFIKKTEKIPKNELELGLKLKKEYLSEKIKRSRK